MEQAKYNERLRKAGLGGHLDARPAEDFDDGIDWHDFIVVQTIEWEQDQSRPVAAESPEQIDAKVQDISSQI